MGAAAKRSSVSRAVWMPPSAALACARLIFLERVLQMRARGLRQHLSLIVDQTYEWRHGLSPSARTHAGQHGRQRQHEHAHAQRARDTKILHVPSPDGGANLTAVASHCESRTRACFAVALGVNRPLAATVPASRAILRRARVDARNRRRAAYAARFAHDVERMHYALQRRPRLVNLEEQRVSRRAAYVLLQDKAALDDSDLWRVFALRIQGPLHSAYVAGLSSRRAAT